MIFRAMGALLLLYKMYRRLPPSQRQRVLKLMGQHGPRLVSVVGRRARTRVRPRG
jgi:hypothetical protein